MTIILYLIIFISFAANSRSTYLSLRVVIPPSEPTLSVAGGQLQGNILGPLQEGHTLRISCRVAGGEPPPKVVWLKDGQVRYFKFTKI